VFEPWPVLPADPGVPAGWPADWPEAWLEGWPEDCLDDWFDDWPDDWPDGELTPVLGACPLWPAESEGGVGHRCGAGSPACPGVEPDALGDDDPGDPPVDDGCPPEADGLPEAGWPPDGDC
jgi:hypothetical protein